MGDLCSTDYGGTRRPFFCPRAPGARIVVAAAQLESGRSTAATSKGTASLLGVPYIACNEWGWDTASHSCRWRNDLSSTARPKRDFCRFRLVLWSLLHTVAGSQRTASDFLIEGLTCDPATRLSPQHILDKDTGGHTHAIYSIEMINGFLISGDASGCLKVRRAPWEVRPRGRQRGQHRSCHGARLDPRLHAAFMPCAAGPGLGWTSLAAPFLRRKPWALLLSCTQAGRTQKE